MRKKLLMTFAIIAAILVVFAVIVAMQPSGFTVSRSATMAASPAVVFPQVNELQKWNAWSPWVKLDPTAKNTFEGPAAGKGAVLAWVGNNKVGQGRMTIVESRPDELVRFHLEFIKPMAGTSQAEFTFKPEGNQTVVTWTMTGNNSSFICKAMSLFMSMDKMVGGEFEKGLASIKTIVEARVSESVSQ